MGSGASTTQGVPQNPRVQYSHKLEKREHKKVLVDAPVLVDVQHGSVRFRHAGNETNNISLPKGKERPYENADKDKHLECKDHYFYHARLNKFGPDSSKENEDPFKFYYVMKGPQSSRHKKIFYVYGQGWGAKDGLKSKPTESVGQGNDYAWSSTRQTTSLYYKLEFTDDGKSASTEEERMMSDLQSNPDKSTLRLTLSEEERARDLKARVAVRLLKCPQDIHIAFDGKELREEDMIGDLRQQTRENPIKATDQEETSVETFGVLLSLV